MAGPAVVFDLFGVIARNQSVAGRDRIEGLSCRIGHVKPDRRAFDWCVRAFGVAAGELLMVDDRADNIEAAEAAGLRAHLFTSIDGLRAALRLADGDTRRRRHGTAADG